MKKRVLSLLLAAMMVFSLAACGSSEEAADTQESTEEATTEDEIEIGTVKIGWSSGYPPFNYDDENGDPTGFEVEMIEEIAERTGLDMELVLVPWDGIFGQMDSGKIDTVMCCIFPSAERQEKYDFSAEYIYDENRFIVRKGEGSLYKTYEDLAGKTIGVAAGGNTYNTLAKLQEEVDFEIAAYNSENFVSDMALGRIDLIYKSPVSAFVQAEDLNAEFELAECPTLESASCALPWRKDDARSAAIREAVSEATREMIEAGTMKELSEKWLGMDLSVYEPLFDF